MDDEVSLSFPSAEGDDEVSSYVSSNENGDDPEETPFVNTPNPGLNLQDVVTFPLAFTNSAYHEVQLLKLLHDIGAPDYSFKAFMEWGRSCSHHNYHFEPTPQGYHSQIRNLTQIVGMNDCCPTSIPVILEPDNLTLDVIVFLFATMLSSLLNCPMLNKIDNLVVNPHDRFGRYESPYGLLDEAVSYTHLTLPTICSV